MTYLQTRALEEQTANCNATFIVKSEDDSRIDAFVTLSVANLVLPVRVRERLRIPHSQVPAVLIGYIAVSDEVRGSGIGRQIFDWVKAQAFELNRVVGVRLLYLEVEAENWGAFRHYVNNWGLKSIPLKEPTRHANSQLRERPQDIGPRERIQLYFDLFEAYGSYWPGPGDIGVT